MKSVVAAGHTITLLLDKVMYTTQLYFVRSQILALWACVRTRHSVCLAGTSLPIANDCCILAIQRSLKSVLTNFLQDSDRFGKKPIDG
jgi:hypothetical protein